MMQLHVAFHAIIPGGAEEKPYLEAFMDITLEVPSLPKSAGDTHALKTIIAKTHGTEAKYITLLNWLPLVESG